MAIEEKDPRIVEVHPHYKLYLAYDFGDEPSFVGWVDTPEPVLSRDGFIRFWPGNSCDEQPQSFLVVEAIHFSKFCLWSTEAIPVIKE